MCVWRSPTRINFKVFDRSMDFHKDNPPFHDKPFQKIYRANLKTSYRKPRNISLSKKPDEMKL